MDLFFTFLLIGSVSFGGGYAMLPVIEHQVVDLHNWMTIKQFTDVIAVAGMSPGPIATNSAIFIGYKLAGLPGALISMAGMILPSLAIILVVAAFFYKVHDHHIVKSAFYGLRPIITGLIFYAALKFAVSNRISPSAITHWSITLHRHSPESLPSPSSSLVSRLIPRPTMVV
jgi:chromate transporter